MSKVSKILFTLFLVSFYLFTYLPQTASAATCNLTGTNPNPVYTESENATFKIDVGNNNEPGISSWKMEFQCGVRYQQPDASKNSDGTTISTTIDRSRKPQEGCEFSEGSHTIQVKALNAKGEWLDWCPAVSYKVINPDLFCKLSIDPTTKLTSNSTIKVSGENLTSGGQFQLFIDKDDSKINPDRYVNTPGFSGITIPTSYLSPTKHTLYLKRYYIVTAPIPGASNLGAPLCPLEFTIGTESSPGSVTGGSNITNSSGVKLCQAGDPTCTTAGGTQCGSADSPGVATAIGCIHTNPLDFIKDLFKFLTGIGGGIAFLMMLLGAFQMITSAGNPETLQAGRERFTSAIIGLLFVIFAVLLLQIIGFDILKIPGFGR